MNKVRFGHSLVGIDKGLAVKASLADARLAVRNRFTSISFDTVIEAKGAVTAKCFMNPMRGGCVLTLVAEALRASVKASLDVLRTFEKRSDKRTPAIAANTLRRHIARQSALSETSGNIALSPSI